MKKVIVGVVLALLSVVCAASCPALYPHNTQIEVKKTTELCNDMYVSIYDVANRRALFTSELLQPTGHVVQRKESFRGDRRVPTNMVLPTEYAGSKYDRGHLTPADDSTSASQMYQSFLMTNMTPQNPTLNRGRWKMLEERVRSQAGNIGTPVHVITGAVYKGSDMLGTIPVPSGYYKIAYYPAGTKAYYSDNTRSGLVKEVTLDWVRTQTNIKFPN